MIRRCFKKSCMVIRTQGKKQCILLGVNYRGRPSHSSSCPSTSPPNSFHSLPTAISRAMSRNGSPLGGVGRVHVLWFHACGTPRRARLSPASVDFAVRANAGCYPGEKLCRRGDDPHIGRLGWEVAHHLLHTHTHTLNITYARINTVAQHTHARISTHTRHAHTRINVGTARPPP